MNTLVSVLNKLPIDSLLAMTGAQNASRLWIENGRITGFVSGNNEKLHKEIPTQTANPSGDE